MKNRLTLRRWDIILSNYDFDLYTSGSQHKDIDCLSRPPVDSKIDPHFDDKIYANSTNIKKVDSVRLVTPRNPDEWMKETEYDHEALPLLSKARQSENVGKFINKILYENLKLYVSKSKRHIILELSHCYCPGTDGGMKRSENLY